MPAADSSYQPLLDTYFNNASDDLKSAFPKAQQGKPGNSKPKANTIDTSKAQKTFNWKPIAEKDTVWVVSGSLRRGAVPRHIFPWMSLLAGIQATHLLSGVLRSIDMVESLAKYQKERWSK